MPKRNTYSQALLVAFTAITMLSIPAGFVEQAQAKVTCGNLLSLKNDIRRQCNAMKAMQRRYLSEKARLNRKFQGSKRNAPRIIVDKYHRLEHEYRTQRRICAQATQSYLTYRQLAHSQGLNCNRPATSPPRPVMQPPGRPGTSGGNRCPDPFPRLRTSYTNSNASLKIDTNGNPKDKTYIDCYYHTGKRPNLWSQRTYVNGKKDGEQFGFLNTKACGRYMSSREIYRNGKRVFWWTYSCNSKTGNVYKMTIVAYSNGIQTNRTQWHDNGVKRGYTDYKPNGKPATSYSWNKQGKMTYCTKWDRRGNPHRCNR